MIVIPMGGRSRRFQEAGYSIPKYMLPLPGGYVFDRAVSSFDSYFSAEKFVFVIRPEEGVEEFVKERIKYLNIQSFSIVRLQGDTLGQAETVRIGLEGPNYNIHEPVTIFNIDTFRPLARFPPFASGILQGADLHGYVEVFRAEGAGWSFVVPDENRKGFSRSVIEKKRVSDLCCTGLYWFSSSELFLQAYSQEKELPSQATSEDFVAPIFNQLIKRKLSVGWLEVPSSSVIPCGVPAEYEALLAVT